MSTAPTTGSTTRTRLGRWARWGLLLAAVLMVAALIAAVLSSYNNVRQASAALLRGQGETLLQNIRGRLHRVSLEESVLEELLETYSENGLRYVAILGPGGRPKLEAGTARGHTTMSELHREGGTAMREIGDRVRLSVVAPGPRGRGRGRGYRRGRRFWQEMEARRGAAMDWADRPEEPPGPPPEGRGRPPREDETSEPDEDRPPARDQISGPPPPVGHPPPGRPRPGWGAELGPGSGRGPAVGPPHMLMAPMAIEFEPIVARTLRRDAARSVGVGGAAAIALMAAVFLLLRWLLLRETIERERERERRLASLGEMSAVLAHEIRNPLASLKGHAQLLAEGLPERSRERDKADRVVGEAIRMEALTTDLLEFVRSGQIERQLVDPGALVREVVDSVGGDRAEIDLAGAPAQWSLDPHRIRQVLNNLLQNAIQASPEGAWAEMAVRSEAGQLCFTVRDHGDGIATGEEEKIFVPFHTGRTRGVGLGLAVARRLVELHGGTITARNHEAGGAIFRVALPKA